MSTRWTITTPAPKTARCKACKRVSNRLSVYPAGGCYACLHVSTSLVATTAAGCAPDCARLPRHKGACRPTLHRHVRIAA